MITRGSIAHELGHATVISAAGYRGCMELHVQPDQSIHLMTEEMPPPDVLGRSAIVAVATGAFFDDLLAGTDPADILARIADCEAVIETGLFSHRWASAMDIRQTYASGLSEDEALQLVADAMAIAVGLASRLDEVDAIVEMLATDGKVTLQ